MANYSTANGVVQGLRFRMPPMTIAGVTVHNVIGSVSKNDTGKTILLGQSFLRKFKAWQIDNTTGQLVLAYKPRRSPSAPDPRLTALIGGSVLSGSDTTPPWSSRSGEWP